MATPPSDHATQSRTHVQNAGITCEWRTPRFHDRECSRFFDCPSHVVERCISDDDTEQPEASDTLDSPSQRTLHQPPRTFYPPHPEDRHSAMDGADSSPSGNDASNPFYVTSRFIPTNFQDRELPPLPPHPSDPPGAINVPPQVSSQGGSVQEPTIQGNFEEGVQEHANRIRDGRNDNGTGLAVSTEADLPLTERLDSTTIRGARSNDIQDLRDALNQPASANPDQTPEEEEEEGEEEEVEEEDREGQDETGGFVTARWQPDAEVTYCPICRSQFSVFVRKHHCRKCGRVVCNSCSPHRIIIPHQYIVRHPGSDLPLPHNLLLDGLSTRYSDPNSAVSGGERVRLCNPCVPDPNPAPPQLSRPPNSRRHRSRSTMMNGQGTSNTYSGIHIPGEGQHTSRHHASRLRSSTILPTETSGSGPSVGLRQRGMTVRHMGLPPERFLSRPSDSNSASSYPARLGSFGTAFSSSASPSRRRAHHTPPQIAEEDECPVCHRELPSRTLPNSESLRESHINTCVTEHSRYGSPRGTDGETSASVEPRRTGMYTYPATEKDCIDDAECTICLEEFMVGVTMARLECLCRFHKTCIAAWFVNHPGRCPVHQHDGYGY